MGRALIPRPLVHRRLAAFLLINAVALNLVLAWWVHSVSTDVTSNRPTTLHFSLDYLRRAAGSDSWTPMRRALAYLNEPHAKPLYSEIFFERGIKFQYAPTSLLLLEPLRRVPGLTSDTFLNLLSWLAVAGTAIGAARILSLGLSRAARISGTAPRSARVAEIGLAVGFTLSFYPIVRGFHIGQIQTWIDLLFAGLIWTWMTDRKRASGALAGLVCVIKPTLSLLLLWGLLRRQWHFVTGWAWVVLPVTGISLGAYGLANHVDYVSVLAFIGRHGESFHQNQSMNGLLHRLFFNGNNLVWNANGFAPYHPVVYAGTLLSSLLLVGGALFFRRSEHDGASLVDLLIAVMSISLAAPIVWDHHLGIALPIFAFALPATLSVADRSSMRWGLVLLGVAFVLLSTKFPMADLAANTPVNFLQSYLFFGALLLLWQLYRLRKSGDVLPFNGDVQR